ncbi:hypothetical protein BJV78DRAFT_1279489 [Lactifluus subvellereus]|nr:hypothetical protein BJV78DRAFT_1279489 [Lactifluus subvellereus]
MDIIPPPNSSSDRPALKGEAKPKRSHPEDSELSVFDILNIFRRRWFLSRAHLLTNVISAQKAEDGNISWVEFTPQYHSHLVNDRPALKGEAKPKRSHPEDSELSVFDILNIFRRRWFLSRAHLLTNVISAQKAEDGNISWVEFTPQYHSHLVKCAIALVPHPVLKVKKVISGYILEFLNGKGDLAFFNLQMGSRKANNAQKEKRRLARTRKRSRASKREREREAVKAAERPTRQRQSAAKPDKPPALPPLMLPLPHTQTVMPHPR